MVDRPDAVSETVLEAVASHAEADPLELPPLYDAIDPDALETLVQDMRDGTVCFEYAGYFITVQSNGTVDIADEPTRRPPHAKPVSIDS